MCMDHARKCTCGVKQASFNFKNNVMPPETIIALYCPSCSKDVEFDNRTMLKDNGWIIQYDIDIADLYSKCIPAQDKENMSPETLFDKGYVTWRGVYPGDHIDSVQERERLATLAKISPRKYFVEMKSWATSRMARLRDEGWRKAYDG